MKRATRQELRPLLGDDRIGFGSRLVADGRQPLKLWLRLLSCGTRVETETTWVASVLAGISGPQTRRRLDLIGRLRVQLAGIKTGSTKIALAAPVGATKGGERR